MVRLINIVLFVCMILPHAAVAEGDIERFKSSLSTESMAVMLLRRNGSIYACSVVENIGKLKLSITKSTARDAAIELVGATALDGNRATVTIVGIEKPVFAVKDGDAIATYLDASTLSTALRAGIKINNFPIGADTLAGAFRTADECMSKGRSDK